MKFIMKTIIVPFFAVALIISGCKQQNNPSSIVDNKAAENPSLSVDPTHDKTNEQQSDEYIVKRVEKIYKDVFDEYNEANKTLTIPTTNWDSVYCSLRWNDVINKIVAYDKAHHPDDIGFFEADYWIMGQDFQDLSISDVKVTSHKDTQAEVALNIHNFDLIPIQLNMVYERDDWFIDNFIQDGLDWGQSAIEYLKDGQ